MALWKEPTRSQRFDQYTLLVFRRNIPGQNSRGWIKPRLDHPWSQVHTSWECKCNTFALWHHRAVFTGNVLQELSTFQLMWIIHCEFVTSTFVDQDSYFYMYMTQLTWVSTIRWGGEFTVTLIHAAGACGVTQPLLLITPDSPFLKREQNQDFQLWIWYTLIKK